MRIAGADSLEDGLRQLAVEFIVSFTENKPQISKDIPGFAKNIIEVICFVLATPTSLSYRSCSKCLWKLRTCPLRNGTRRS